jgi:hypothetical protein
LTIITFEVIILNKKTQAKLKYEKDIKTNKAVVVKWKEVITLFPIISMSTPLSSRTCAQGRKPFSQAR